MISTLTRIGAEEFLELYGGDSGIELYQGEIIRLPMPDSEHGYICINVGAILREFVRKHKLGRVVGNDSFVRTGVDSIRGSDVSYVSYQIIPAGQKLPKALIPPFEFVAEVRSPSDSRKSFFAKGNEYLDAGVQVVMLVEPDDSRVFILRAGAEPEQYELSDTLTLPDILPGFSTPVREIFE